MLIASVRIDVKRFIAYFKRFRIMRHTYIKEMFRDQNLLLRMSLPAGMMINWRNMNRRFMQMGVAEYHEALEQGKKNSKEPKPAAQIIADLKAYRERCRVENTMVQMAHYMVIECGGNGDCGRLAVLVGRTAIGSTGKRRHHGL